MKKIIRAIPNVSEGRDRALIQALASTIRAQGQVELLDVAADAAHHRTVFTLEGPPDQVEEALMGLVGLAVEKIDLAQHRGEHPRMGAVDVIALVPGPGAQMVDAIELSHRLGERIWSAYQVPVFYYEESQAREERKKLAQIRRGEFEGLVEKLQDPAWQPDVGLGQAHPRAGAVAIGARRPLVAFNINLASADLALAQSLARQVRESGGGLPAVQALGLLAEDGQVQVSMNLTNTEVTPIAQAFEEVKALAQEAGVQVASSEFIGRVPREALDAVVASYLQLKHDLEE